MHQSRGLASAEFAPAHPAAGRRRRCTPGGPLTGHGGAHEHCARTVVPTTAWQAADCDEVLHWLLTSFEQVTALELDTRTAGRAPPPLRGARCQPRAVRRGCRLAGRHVRVADPAPRAGRQRGVGRRPPRVGPDDRRWASDGRPPETCCRRVSSASRSSPAPATHTKKKGRACWRPGQPPPASRPQCSIPGGSNTPPRHTTFAQGSCPPARRSGRPCACAATIPCRAGTHLGAPWQCDRRPSPRAAPPVAGGPRRGAGGGGPGRPGSRVGRAGGGPDPHDGHRRDPPHPASEAPGTRRGGGSPVGPRRVAAESRHPDHHHPGRPRVRRHPDAARTGRARPSGTVFGRIASGGARRRSRPPTPVAFGCAGCPFRRGAGPRCSSSGTRFHPIWLCEQAAMLPEHPLPHGPVVVGCARQRPHEFLQPGAVHNHVLGTHVRGAGPFFSAVAKGPR